MRQTFFFYSKRRQFVTSYLLYAIVMNISMLLSSSIGGIFSIIALFGFCFACVHVIKLAKIGREVQKEYAKKSTESKEQNSPTPIQKEEKQAKEKPSEQNAGEPIYYIVERKRRTKSSFGEPKRIHFK